MNIFETAKPGLALLREAFPEPLFGPDGLGEFFPELAERRPLGRRIEILPVFPPSEDGRPQVDPDSASASNVSADLLAWYVPYAVAGEEHWGMYFDVVKMERFAELVYALSYRVRPDITRTQVQTFIWDSVTRHEVEHGVQELTVAKLVLGAPGSRAHLTPTFLSDGGLIETLAAHYEYTQTNYRTAAKGPNQASNFLVHLVAGLQNLPEYREWNWMNIIDTEDQFEAHFSLSRNTKFMPELRKKTKGKFDSDFLTIPAYLV